jgi:hypothetical protein
LLDRVGGMDVGARVGLGALWIMAPAIGITIAMGDAG